MAGKSTRVVITSLERFLEGVIKKLTLDIVANLLRPSSEGGTPVDTGWARANWIPSLTALASNVPAPQPGGDDKNATISAVPGQEGQQESSSALIASTYRLPMGSITIANNVPYITKLNGGSSKKAAKGFVQAAIRRAVTIDLPAGFRV